MRDDDYGPARTERRRERSAPYQSRKSFDVVEEDDDREWKHDKFEQTNGSSGFVGGRVQGGKHRLEPGSSIIVSNLDSEVTEDDVKDIFAQIGTVKSVQIIYDKNGTSQGSAEVTFRGKDDAEKAVTEYNEAEVDGRVMYLKIIADVVAGAPVVVKKQRVGPPRQISRSSFGARRGRGAPRGAFGRGYNNYGNNNYSDFPPRRARGRGRGSGRSRGRGRGRGAGGNRKEEVTSAALDQEMDDWQANRGSTTTAAAAVNPTAAGQPSLPAAEGKQMEDSS